MPNLADRYPAGQPDEPGDVIVMGVGRHHQAQLSDAVPIERLPELALIRSAVDEHRLSVRRHEQCRIALTDVEEHNRRSAQSGRDESCHQGDGGARGHHRSDWRPANRHQESRDDQGNGREMELGIPSGDPGDRQHDLGSKNRRREKETRSGDNSDRSEKSCGGDQRRRNQVGERSKQGNAIALHQEERHHRRLSGDRYPEGFPEQARNSLRQQIVPDHDPRRCRQ